MASSLAASSLRTKPSLQATYLVSYNVASAVAWAVVLGRTIAICALRSGPAYVYDGVGTWTKWTQTMAALEIVHSMLGIVRARVFTTLMQVASRCLLVWAIVETAPMLALSPFYSSMLAAWSIAEVIRYTYFALSLSGFQSSSLVWLRYNGFYVLYPVGIISECLLAYKASVMAAASHRALVQYLLYAILVLYVPGAFFLYMHMMSQRRKMMRSSKADHIKSR